MDRIVTSESAPTTRMKRCPMCSEMIQVGAQKCKHCGEYLSPAARRAAGLAARPVSKEISVKSPFGSAILGTLLFLPIGIVALIFASQVSSKMAAGDVQGAISARNTSQILSLVADIIGLIFIVLYAVALKS